MKAAALGSLLQNRRGSSKENHQLAQFEQSDAQRLNGLLRLGAAAVKTCDLYSREQRNTSKLGALLTLLSDSSLAVQQRDMKKLVLQISSSAQKIFECERCTFFMVDNFTEMLIGHFVTNQGGSDEATHELRVPMQGVVGCAAREGRVLNIQDAWNNPLFSNANDLKTGYRTKTILCAPLKTSNGKVIAVIQCINKIRNEYFGMEDENMISTISSLMSDLIQRMSLETSYHSFIKSSETIASDVKDLFREYYAEGAPVQQQDERDLDSLMRVASLTDLPTGYLLDRDKPRLSQNDALMMMRNWAVVDYGSLAEDTATCLSQVTLYFQFLGLMRFMKPPAFEAFVRGLKARYNHFTSYHNWTHAFATLHVTFLLCDNSAFRKLMEKEDLLGLLLAALGHDVEHPGRNNAFQVATQSKLALRYNDIGVLENHHAAVTCGMCMGEDQNIFEKLQPEFFRRMRKVIVEAILGTDMAKHQECVSWLQSCNINLAGLREQRVKLDKDQGLRLASSLLHCADLAHPALPWRVHKLMSKNVAIEFYSQFQEEQKLGLPTLPFMGKDPENINELAPIQVGFVQFVVAPVWKALSETAGEDHLKFIVENIESNRRIWKKLGDGEEVDDNQPYNLPHATGQGALPQLKSEEEMARQISDWSESEASRSNSKRSVH
jgi:GAF domain-containing protein